MYLEFKHPTVEAESNFDIMAYFINWKFIHYNNLSIYH